MAVTSIWSVKGWLGRVVDYAKNPEKTSRMETNPLSAAIMYAVNQHKTKCDEMEFSEESAVKEQYVSGINCSPATALMEMSAVKKRFGKEDGIMAFHGYQSFAPGECTPALAHEIGIKLAERLWGEEYQVVVATHLDKTHHLHNHFVVNSVSFRNGKRYHRTNQDYRMMQETSDALCREYKLSVIEQPTRGRTRQYGEWKAEQERHPTWRGLIQADVDEAIEKARTETQFFRYLEQKGYSFKFGKDITVRPAGKERGMKLARNLGERYTMEEIRKRIISEEKENPKRESQRFDFSEKKYVWRVTGRKPKARKRKGIKGLYLHYCYRLGILPTKRKNYISKEVHFLLREDLRKLNTIQKETKLLCRYHIETEEQLLLKKEELEERKEHLTEKRKHLRYQSRSRSGEELESIRGRCRSLTAEIGKIREELRLCDSVLERSCVMQEKLSIIHKEEKESRKEEKAHEYIRRSR